AQVQRERPEVDPVDDRRDTHDVGRGGVVADLQLVLHAAADDSLQVEHRVGRIVLDVDDATGHAFRLQALALIVEHAAVGAPARSHAEVDAAAERVFLDVLQALPPRAFSWTSGRLWSGAMSRSGFDEAPGRITALGARKPGRSAAIAGTARA